MARSTLSEVAGPPRPTLSAALNGVTLDTALVIGAELRLHRLQRILVSLPVVLPREAASKTTPQTADGHEGISRLAVSQCTSLPGIRCPRRIHTDVGAVVSLQADPAPSRAWQGPIF